MEDQPKDIDWDYIHKHTDSENYKVPTFYDSKSWKIGETYSMRIIHLYDPSKFWIVLYERELNLFQDFIYKFYTTNAELYKMPEQSIKRLNYCVVFTDESYYRALIVDKPFFASLQSKVSVFLFDFGYNTVVSTNDVYYFTKGLFKVPQFSVRACLYGLEPYSTDFWTAKEVTRFYDLATGERLLFVLEQTDPTRKVLYITIDNITKVSQDKTIRDIMISEKVAKMTCPENENTRHEPKVKAKMQAINKYSYLFPSFDAIESAQVPSTVENSEQLKTCIPVNIVLFKNYISYKGIDVDKCILPS